MPPPPPSHFLRFSTSLLLHTVVFNRIDLLRLPYPLCCPFHRYVCVCVFSFVLDVCGWVCICVYVCVICLCCYSFVNYWKESIENTLPHVVFYIIALSLSLSASSLALSPFLKTLVRPSPISRRRIALLLACSLSLVIILRSLTATVGILQLESDKKWYWFRESSSHNTVHNMTSFYLVHVLMHIDIVMRSHRWYICQMLPVGLCGSSSSRLCSGNVVRRRRSRMERLFVILRKNVIVVERDRNKLRN